MKPKESKGGLSKKPSNTNFEQPWRERSLALDFSTSENRPCEVLLMVESDEKCSDIIYSCYKGYKLNPLSQTKIISYTDVEQDIIECANRKDDTGRGEVFKEAYGEAMQYLKAKKPMPSELLSHLIKLKIVQIIQEDISAEQEELFVKMAKENEYKKMFDTESATDGKKKGKGKKEEDKKKGKEKESKDSKKKRKEASGTAEGANKVPTDPPKALSQFRNPGGHPEIQVETKQLYIALIGLYDPDIVRCLVQVGVPLSCLLEVSTTQSMLFKTQTCNEVRSSSSNENTSSEVAGESSEGTGSTREDQTELEINNHTADKGEASELTPEGFWDKVFELIHAEQQHSYLENVFHMFYKAIEWMPPLEDEDVDAFYDDISQKQFEELSRHVTEIEILKRQHINYVRHLRLHQITYAPTFMTPKCLKLYNKLMDRFPPDCFSIALLIACLVEEVCSRIKTDSSQSSFSDNRKSADVSLEPSETGLDDATETHGGVRDQVLNILSRYKTRHEPSGVSRANSQFRCYTCSYNPKVDLKPDSKCFMTQASNDLQIVTNCYKKLSKDFYAVNLSGLKKCKAAIVRSYYTVSETMEKLMNEYNLQSWGQALLLSKEELCDAIHTFLITRLKGKSDNGEGFGDWLEADLLPHVKSSMLLDKYKVTVQPVPDPFEEADDLMVTQLGQGGSYRRHSETVHKGLLNADLGELCYKEHLPAFALLQQLFKADCEYEHVDRLYCPITDTLLLFFHNNLDKFGTTTDFTKSFLLTPVCLRDFCEHVLPDEKRWIEDQEFYYQCELNKEAEALKHKKEELRKTLHSDFIPDDSYFILPDSIKAKLLKGGEEKPDADGKKKGKGDKKKDKGDKKKDSPKKGSDEGKKGSKASSTSSKTQLDIDEVLMGMPDVPPKKKLSLRCAEAGEPFQFIAYDLGQSRVHVNGWRTLFCSADGLRVVVERTCWLGSTPTVSVKLITMNDNIIFHYKPDVPATEPFMFHFALSDDSVLAFSRPEKFRKVEDIICERICRSKQNKPPVPREHSAYQPKRQEIYFVSEKQDCVIKSLRVPFSTERNLVLSEELLVPFLDSLEKFNIRARITAPSETLRERQKRRHNLRRRLHAKAESDVNTQGRKSSTKNLAIEKYKPKIIARKLSEISAKEADADEFTRHSFQAKTIGTPPPIIPIAERKEMLEKLREALANHIPLFKICSSKLHKFAYVKRVKSYVNIPIGGVIKRVLYKPAYYKTRRKIEIKKCFPLGSFGSSKIKQPTYNVRVSLPSGLMVRDVPGIASKLPCVKQYYVDKGPQCKDIVHEESRTFMRNGSVAIKRCDGNIDVLSANGRIFHFEIPYIMKTRAEKVNYRDANLSGQVVPLHCVRRSLTAFQKLLHRILPRRFKHTIDSNESRYFLSRRAHLRAQKKYCTNLDALYLLDVQRRPFPEYTVVTPDGKKIKISKSKVYEEQRFYVATDTDYRLEETLFERDDGTCCVLNRDGVFTVQFPDSTRLTTWFVESASLAYADDIGDANVRDEIMQTDALPKIYSSRLETVRSSRLETVRSRLETIQSEPLDTAKHYDEFGADQREGWVSIYMYYQCSHPNYATVVFGGEDDEMNVILPNDCKIACKGRNTNVTVGTHIETEFNREKFCLKSKCCRNCLHFASAVLDVGPLYRATLPKNKNADFVRVKDSFDRRFWANYEGKCSRNSEKTAKPENDCFQHATPAPEKLFAVRNDLSGCVFWSRTDFKNLVSNAEKSENISVDTYPNGEDANAVVELRENIYKPYHERFMLKYDEPFLKLTKYKTKAGDRSFGGPAYVLRYVLHKIVDFNKLEPLYNCILENCEKHGLKNENENFDTFFESVTQYVTKQKSVLSTQECPETCACASKKQQEEDRKLAKTLHDKWYEWQEECKKYKQLIKEQYVPLYFKSKFAEEFKEENRKQEEHTPSAINQPKVRSRAKLRASDSETSFDGLPGNDESILVDKEKSIETRNAGDRVEKVIKETLHIAVPKDLVVLYNQGRGNRQLEITDEKILASEEQGKEGFSEKMLVLTGVTDSSKLKIANKFLELQGAPRKYEEGSKVIIVSQETEKGKELKEAKAESFEGAECECGSEKEDVGKSSVSSHQMKSSSRVETEIDLQQTESASFQNFGDTKEDLASALTSQLEIASNKSATEVLRDMVRTSKDYLAEMAPSSATADDVACSDSARKNVLSVLSSLMRTVIAALSRAPEDIPSDVSSSIINSAYRHISGANLTQEEMKFLVETLNGIVEEAVGHVCPSESSSEPVLELSDKSKLIPVKHIGGVLSHYSKFKRTPKLDAEKTAAGKCRFDTTGVNTDEACVCCQRSGPTTRSTSELSDGDSDITVSYTDFDVTESMIGFTSKANFLSATEQKKSANFIKEKLRSVSNAMLKDNERRSSCNLEGVARARVSFSQTTDSGKRTSSLKLIHQGPFRSPPSSTVQETVKFDSKILTHFANSITTVDDSESYATPSELIFDAAVAAARPPGRFKISEGTQTCGGDDVIVQTSDQLLTGKFEWKGDFESV